MLYEPRYTVVVADNSGTRIGKVDVITELDVLCRFNDVGNWKVVVPASSPQAELLVNGRNVMIHRGDEAGPLLMSGRAEQLEFHRNDSQPGGGTLWVSGSSDEAVIADRLAYPDPSKPAEEQDEQTNDVRTGTSEAVMKAYVEYNAGPSALAARQVPDLTVASGSSLGETVTGNPRFTPLKDVLNELATTGGELGWRVVRVLGVGREFQVFQPTDRTGTAKFGWELGNLAQFEMTHTAPKVTRVVVGGGGEGTARLFREVADTDAETEWDRRVEVFRDARDTSETDVLDQRGFEELVEKGKQVSVRVSTVDIPHLRFGEHYFLGDKVTVLPGYGQVIKDIVREVRIQWNSQSGEQVTTEVGTSSANSTPRMKAELDRLNKRVAELEANQ